MTFHLVENMRDEEHPFAFLATYTHRLLDFSPGVWLDGQPLSEADLASLLAAGESLVRLKGQWVEGDREKLAAALEPWKRVERGVRDRGLTFFDGMRLLSEADLDGAAEDAAEPALREWSSVAAGEWLDQTLTRLRDPAQLGATVPVDLRTELRPYQQVGLRWLSFLKELRLGACLADDMGLGKTVQVLALLLEIRAARQTPGASDAARRPACWLCRPR